MSDASHPPLAVARAPGKVILLGEHAVVYGEPAIAIPVRAVSTTATVRAADGPLTIDACFPPVEDRPRVRRRLEDAGPLAAVARTALELRGRSVAPWHVTIESTIPTGRGMGSSAAVAVALADALWRAADAVDGASSVDRDAAIAEIAMVGEREVHGTPSGIDPAVVRLDRPLHFHGGRITPVPMEGPLSIVIGDTGVSSDTGQMVDRVRVRLDERPETVARWIAQLGEKTEDGLRAMVAGSPERLGRAMDAAHTLLRGLGVSTPALDRLVAAARDAGALGAKLSGSGGGGVMIALVEPGHERAVARALEAAGATDTWLCRVTPES